MGENLLLSVNSDGSSLTLRPAASQEACLSDFRTHTWMVIKNGPSPIRQQHFTRQSDQAHHLAPADRAPNLLSQGCYYKYHLLVHGWPVSTNRSFEERDLQGSKVLDSVVFCELAFGSLGKQDKSSNCGAKQCNVRSVFCV